MRWQGGSVSEYGWTVAVQSINYQIRKESSAKWYHLMQAVLQESAGSKVREMYLKLTLRRPEQDIEQEIEQQSMKY